MMRILVAGFGNPLRQDDGFGVALIERLHAREDLPDDVELLEVGIGGISLVQQLMTGFDALIVLDALAGDDDETAGVVKTLALDIVDLKDRPATAVRETFADIHYAEPGRALALAKAVGALPDAAFMIGAVLATSELGEGLTPAVENALGPATEAVLRLLRQLIAGEAIGTAKS